MNTKQRHLQRPTRDMRAPFDLRPRRKFGELANSGGRFAAKYLGFAMAMYLLFVSAGGARADEQADYLAQVRETFQHLFQGRHFMPSGGACGRLPGRCDALLNKLGSSDFSFIPPIERSDRPDMPSFRRLQNRCRNLNLGSHFDGVPAEPTNSFAVYRMANAGGIPEDAQKTYILRAEDYVSGINTAKILDDGGFIIFSYPTCRVLKQISIEKSHKSPYAPGAANPELNWISEPILVDGKGFILSIHAINGTAPNPPLYVLRLTSIFGFAGSGGEAYSFSAKGR